MVPPGATCCKGPQLPGFRCCRDPLLALTPRRIVGKDKGAPLHSRWWSRRREFEEPWRRDPPISECVTLLSAWYESDDFEDARAFLVTYYLPFPFLSSPNAPCPRLISLAEVPSWVRVNLHVHARPVRRPARSAVGPDVRSILWLMIDDDPKLRVLPSTPLVAVFQPSPT